MNWIEVIVHTTTEGADEVSDLLIEAGSSGTMIEDRNDIPDPSKPHGFWEIIDPKLIDAMPEDVLVHGWFEDGDAGRSALSGLRMSLDHLRPDRPDSGTLDMDFRTVSDEAWTDTWKKYYKPFYAADHLLIKPTWEACTPSPEDQIIEIDPGMAFGSGTHETTGMCIRLLQEYLSGGEKVIDVGTGSGILAIAAGLFGAGSVTAIDIDPDAVRVADENVRHNRLDHLIKVQEGNLLDRVDETCDICVANIISDVIIGFAAPLMRHIVPGGLFICSGITRERADDVRLALLEAGYSIQKQEFRGEWTAFVSRR